MSLPGQVALGTMHGKAAAIAPPLARLGIAVVVPEGLDTDRFGTFTGEVLRAGTMVEAARAKAQAAIAATGLPVGLASEGAYAAVLEKHPAVRALFDNGWLHLFVLDGGRIAARYRPGLTWEGMGTVARKAA